MPTPTSDEFAWNSYEEVDPERLYYLEKAEFCLRTGIAPSEFDNMTKKEQAIFVEVFKKIHSKK